MIMPSSRCSTFVTNFERAHYLMLDEFHYKEDTMGSRSVGVHERARISCERGSSTDTEVKPQSVMTYFPVIPLRSLNIWI
jgi:hypothetical protein